MKRLNRKKEKESTSGTSKIRHHRINQSKQTNENKVFPMTTFKD